MRRSLKAIRAAQADARGQGEEAESLVSRMEPISVRIPEAVRLTGVSRSKLYELIKAREIEVVKLGSATLVLTSSLREFINRLRA